MFNNTVIEHNHNYYTNELDQFEMTTRQTKKVSVIISCYNAELYIHNCFDSIMMQTYENIEIIAVDDGSTDSTAKIIKSYAHSDSRFKYYFKENAGVATARNTGLSYVTGDYVLFLDADDYVEKNLVHDILDLSMQEDADIVMFGYITEFEGKPIPTRKNEKKIKTITGKDAIMNLLCDGHSAAWGDVPY